mgnify:FL=1
MSEHAASAPPAIETLGELRAAGYRFRTVKQELRENVLRLVAAGEPLFPAMIGYQETVIPQIAAAILSMHDILLLGLRGQAKTRMLRSMVDLLDEWIPVISPEAGGDHPVELRDDPIRPLTRAGREAVARLGDRTPIRWVHRSERYLEKLATPDVTIADLIGEIDLVKYAAGVGGMKGRGGGGLADERTMHFGLIPRASRGIFAINELPDLAPRIQVGLFNVLEERDVQIRGYAVRLDLDVCLMFSANPEDYTNRGRIVTPLKDRIGSVVRTHYPPDNREAMRITRENAFLQRGTRAQGREGTEGESRPVGGMASAGASGVADRWSEPKAPEVVLPDVMHEIIEEMIRQARRSPHVNQSSGVSVRASIAAAENVVSAAELRALKTGAERVVVRVCDLPAVLAACRGKIELMLGDDGEGADGRSTEDRLLEALLGEAVRAVAGRWLNVGRLEEVAEAFAGGVRIELGDDVPAGEAVASMGHIPGLIDAARGLVKALSMNPQDVEDVACCGELVLEFLYVNNRISKFRGGYAR